jgi:hypothetical protein
MLMEGAAILDASLISFRLAGKIEQTIFAADAELSALRARWDERSKRSKRPIRPPARTPKIQDRRRGIHSPARQIEELRPLREKKETLTRDLPPTRPIRRNLLDEWFNLQSAEYRALEKAAKRVSRKLEGQGARHGVNGRQS